MCCSARVSLAVLVCFAHLAAQDVIAVRAGSEATADSAVSVLIQADFVVPVWWWELVGRVECWVGLVWGESRSAVAWERVEWWENRASPAEWLLEDDIPV